MTRPSKIPVLSVKGAGRPHVLALPLGLPKARGSRPHPSRLPVPSRTSSSRNGPLATNQDRLDSCGFDPRPSIAYRINDGLLTPPSTAQLSPKIAASVNQTSDNEPDASSLIDADASSPEADNIISASTSLSGVLLSSASSISSVTSKHDDSASILRPKELDDFIYYEEEVRRTVAFMNAFQPTPAVYRSRRLRSRRSRRSIETHPATSTSDVIDPNMIDPVDAMPCVQCERTGSPMFKDIPSVFKVQPRRQPLSLAHVCR